MKTLKDVNWNQVYCFYEVARLQSMTEAAKALGLSTPTISEQVNKLETHLGLDLFKRRSRGIQITDEGHSLFLCAREMFEAGSRFLDVVTHDAVGGYTARVGIHEVAASGGTMDFLTSYWDAFSPFGTVTTTREMYYESLLEGLLRGRIDWGLSLEMPRSSRFDHRQVATMRTVFCCSRPAYAAHGDERHVLQSLPMMRGTKDKSLAQRADEQLRASGNLPNEILDCDHLDLILRLVLNGRCVGFLPYEMIAPYVDTGSIVVLAEGAAVESKVYALWMKANERMIAIRKLTGTLDGTSPSGDLTA